VIPLGFCLGTFGVGYPDLRDAARSVDDLGFDSVWVWDHHVSWNRPDEPVLEGLTVLGGLAEATHQVRLGTLVANVLNRTPARLAKIASTLQEVSGGRFELGIGAGGLDHEQRPFGVEQGDGRARYARLAEAVAVIPQLWTGRPVTFHGRFVTLDAAVLAPVVERPRLILGSGGPSIARLAGRRADGLNLHWHVRDRYPALFAALDEGLAVSGRTRAGFDLSVHASIVDLDPDPAAAVAAWEDLGFTRVIAYAPPPWSEAVLAGIARALGLV
jgi:alkanesulfonate monooxygenase SsuD/methylene tetrahydromethanopterin reductase-like flavin-dependent oxidoreductase (luciferase family)